MLAAALAVTSSGAHLAHASAWIVFFTGATLILAGAFGVVLLRNPVHCAEPTNDGLVYVCDRPNDRIQVFQKDGKFVKEAIVSKNTLGSVVTGQFGVVSSFGSAWDVAFSNDAQQRYLFVADGRNQKIHVLDRQSLDEVAHGHRGRGVGVDPEVVPGTEEAALSFEGAVRGLTAPSCSLASASGRILVMPPLSTAVKPCRRSAERSVG